MVPPAERLRPLISKATRKSEKCHVCQCEPALFIKAHRTGICQFWSSLAKHLAECLTASECTLSWWSLSLTIWADTCTSVAGWRFYCKALTAEWYIAPVQPPPHLSYLTPGNTSHPCCGVRDRLPIPWHVCRPKTSLQPSHVHIKRHDAFWPELLRVKNMCLHTCVLLLQCYLLSLFKKRHPC